MLYVSLPFFSIHTPARILMPCLWSCPSARTNQSVTSDSTEFVTLLSCDERSSSTRTVAKTTAKTAPVDLSNLSFSGGSGSDDVIAGYKAEARVVALKSSGDLCPPGYCHRCR